MQKAEQRGVYPGFVESQSKDSQLTDEQKISLMDKIQAELLSKGLPLTFLFATLATIIKTIAG